MAKKHDYRLQTLFNMREKAKDAAEEVYAEAKKEVARTKKAHQEMLDHLQAMVAQRDAKKTEYAQNLRAGQYNVQQIRANDMHLDRLKQEEDAYLVEIEKHQEVVTRAEKKAEERMQEMLKATQDFKALEKHKEKDFAAFKKEMAQKEEDAVEDIAQAQYFARMRERRREMGED